MHFFDPAGTQALGSTTSSSANTSLTPSEKQPLSSKERYAWDRLFRYVQDDKKNKFEDDAGYLRRLATALKQLYVFAAPYKMLIAAVLFFTIVSQAMAALFPLAIGYIFDHVLAGKDLQLLHIVCALLLLYVVVQVVFLYLGRKWLTLLGARIIRDMRLKVHKHFLNLSVRFLEDFQVGRISARIINDTEAIRSMVHEFLLSFFSNAVRIGMVAIAMIGIDWRLALVSGGFLPFFAWRVERLIKRMKPAAKEMSEDNAQLLARTNETFSIIRLVKAYVKQRREHLNFVKFVDRIVRKRLALRYLHYFIITFWEFSSWVGLILMLWFGGYLVMSNELSVGKLVAFYGLLGMFTAPITVLLKSNETIQTAFASLDRIHEVLAFQPEIEDRPAAIEAGQLRGDIAFEQVCFAYTKRGSFKFEELEHELTLKDITFEVKAGQSVALVGPSGSGKTTLTSLLARFFDIRSGAIYADGIDIRTFQQDSYRRNLGIVLQEAMIFHGTVRENIAYARPNASEEEIRQAAEQAQAWSFIRELPNGLDTEVGERGTLLSGGQKQRLAIARVFLANPRILILDEATSSLDSQSEAQVQDALKKLMQNRTTFVIAHRLSTIVNADLILVFEKGRIVERGRHEELLSKGGLYTQLYEEQFRDVLNAEAALQRGSMEADSANNPENVDADLLGKISDPQLLQASSSSL